MANFIYFMFISPSVFRLAMPVLCGTGFLWKTKSVLHFQLTVGEVHNSRSYIKIKNIQYNTSLS